jgi:hypothetical protein
LKLIILDEGNSLPHDNTKLLQGYFAWHFTEMPQLLGGNHTTTACYMVLRSYFHENEESREKFFKAPENYRRFDLEIPISPGKGVDITFALGSSPNIRLSLSGAVIFLSNFERSRKRSEKSSASQPVGENPETTREHSHSSFHSSLLTPHSSFHSLLLAPHSSFHSSLLLSLLAPCSSSRSSLLAPRSSFRSSPHSLLHAPPFAPPLPTNLCSGS